MFTPNYAPSIPIVTKENIESYYSKFHPQVRAQLTMFPLEEQINRLQQYITKKFMERQQYQSHPTGIVGMNKLETLEYMKNKIRAYPGEEFKKIQQS